MEIAGEDRKHCYHMLNHGRKYGKEITDCTIAGNRNARGSFPVIRTNGTHPSLQFPPNLRAYMCRVKVFRGSSAPFSCLKQTIMFSSLVNCCDFAVCLAGPIAKLSGEPLPENVATPPSVQFF